MNYLGYNSGSADGIYGTKTKSAIKSFQRNNGLTVDVIAGEMTWRYIDIRVDTYSETHGKVPFWFYIIEEAVALTDKIREAAASFFF